MEALYKFSLLLRDKSDYLSARPESAMARQKDLAVAAQTA